MAIQKLKSGNMRVLKNEKWLRYIAFTTEQNINFERIDSLEELTSNYVLNYVEKTIKAAEENELDEKHKYIIEETLKWSEVAKVGLKHQRALWEKKGYNLFVHNIGSAQIYLEESEESDVRIKIIVYSLILTHGLLGQYVRGEVSLSDNKVIYALIEEGLVSVEELKHILTVLNYCIISAVDKRIWFNNYEQLEKAIDLVVSGKYETQLPIFQRIKRLRTISINNGENFEAEYKNIFSNEVVCRKFTKLLEQTSLWYVEAALYDFSFEEFVKIFLIVNEAIDENKVEHISFEYFMKDLYYQYNGLKKINIYKKRIIEKYLSEITIEDIFNKKFKNNLHVNPKISVHKHLNCTIFFNFAFYAAGSKLIEFCTEAEKSDILYESAIILLFDLFNLRKDKYDRFHQEEDYLKTMNQAIDYKKVILDYITGNRVIDIGPGGGALMDLIEDRYPDKNVFGVDIAQNVLDNLTKKKQIEGRRWDVIYGDALNLSQYFKKGDIDTIIFCSILHELFSYIEYNGSKFNYETLEVALKSAFDIIPVGGRIIIRDGVMTEPESDNRIIRFLSEEGVEFLKRYAIDFKGRNVKYQIIGHNEVIMPINDAMEFLYTYTWGERSYVHEINEQFGYFTPSKWEAFILKSLGNQARIIELKHFLQEGYSIALSQKIEFFDENRNSIKLPDSTCIVVIEKI